MELRARLTIGADGLRSTVARRIGLVRRRPKLRKLSLTAHARISGTPEPLGELHLTEGACLGLAPVGAGRLHNLTLVVDADRFGGRVRQDANAFFRSAVQWFPDIESRIGGPASARSPSAHTASRPPPPGDRTSASALWTSGSPASRLLASGPFDWPMRRMATDGAALVGDAAGYYDPFTGQGIFRALRSAEFLAEAADRALAAGDVSARAFRGYARYRNRLVRGTVILQHVIEFVLSRPRMADRAIAALARRPATADALIAVTGDLLPARVLLSRRTLATFLSMALSPEGQP